MDNVVLVADSHDDRRQAFADALDSAGYRTLVARSGSEALATVVQYAPQVVIVRADLTEVQGTDVCLRLKQEQEGRVAVVVTTTAVLVVSEEGKRRSYYIRGPDRPKV